MGCAVSAHAPRPPGPLDRLPSTSDSCSDFGATPGPAVPNPFLEYYTLAALCGREVFGPFLKLQSYDPDSGRLDLSVLILCSEAVRHASPGELRINWWEVQGAPPPGGAAAAVMVVNGRDEAEAVAESVDGLEFDPVCGTEDGARTGGCGRGDGEGRGSDGGSGGDGDEGRADTDWKLGRQQQPRQEQDWPSYPPQPSPQRQQQEQAAQAGRGEGEGGSADGELLYSWRNWGFWRFRLGTTCGQAPKSLRYKVGLMPGTLYDIAVPGLDEPWHVGFYTCNGLETSKEDHGPLHSMRPAEDTVFSLWRDVARCHAERPLHLLLGGGDQLYNDGVFEGPLLRGWDQAQDDRDAAAKAAVPFSDAIRDEVEEFYFSHYCAHWSQPAFSALLTSVPSFNMWDDHDIVDGWGSYHPLINDSAIMRGVFSASQLFYLLFQHHTTLDRLSADGYWCEPASCTLLRLGATVALLAPDTRSCRSQARVLPPDFLRQAAQRLGGLPGSVRHVVVLVGGPMVYPRLPVQDALQKLDDVVTGGNIISVIMQKTGLASSVTKRFGMIEFLDDVIDQWNSNQHIGERDQLLQMITELAEEKGIRFTLLSGDVHCAGYGMLHSRAAAGSPEDRRAAEAGGVALPSEAARAADPRFIPQIISSAMANVPPPAPLLKLLCLAGRRPQPILKDCVLRLVPLFGPAGDTDSLLHGRRNWCEAVLGGPDGHLAFSWRCERHMGSEQVDVFSVTVPPLSNGV